MPRVLTLKIWHPGCWTLDVTKEIDGLELVANTISNSPSHVAVDTHALGDEDVVESFLKWVKGDSRILHSYVLAFSPHKRMLRMFLKYRTEDSIFSLLLSNNVAPIEPVRAVGGREFWRVYTPHDDIAAEVLSDPRLSDCEITALSAHQFDFRRKGRASDREHDVLTPRQMDIALRALEMGYYTWPRGVTAKELAERLGLAAPTVLEHLRKSESKIVRRFLQKSLENGETVG
ncbi:MAG: helix-turn-helix domain-containing protein [Thermoplasmata archaeon]